MESRGRWLAVMPGRRTRLSRPGRRVRRERLRHRRTADGHRRRAEAPSLEQPLSPAEILGRDALRSALRLLPHLRCRRDPRADRPEPRRHRGQRGGRTARDQDRVAAATRRAREPAPAGTCRATWSPARTQRMSRPSWPRTPRAALRRARSATPCSSAVDAPARARASGALIAHPERHLSADLSERIARADRRGAPWSRRPPRSSCRRPAREGMLALARRGLIHVLASDAHSSHGGRPAADLGTGLAALEQVEPLRPHLDWIAQRGAGRDPPRRAPRAAVPGLGLEPAAARPRALSSSTSRREPVPRPWWRKLTAPAAAPRTSASGSSLPRASAAAIAPIIVSPQPSRSRPRASAEPAPRPRRRAAPGPGLPPSSRARCAAPSSRSRSAAPRRRSGVSTGPRT